MSVPEGEECKGRSDDNGYCTSDGHGADHYWTMAKYEWGPEYYGQHQGHLKQCLSQGMFCVHKQPNMSVIHLRPLNYINCT